VRQSLINQDGKIILTVLDNVLVRRQEN